VRYLFLLYGDQSTWGHQSEAEHQDEMAAFGVFERQAADVGVLITNYALQPAARATTRRRSDRQAVLADGPAAGGGEQLRAVYVVSCQDATEAAAWAGKIPLVGRGGFSSVEVRPVLGE
jgi:hypothetical protein